MHVRILFFGSYREMIGARERDLSLPLGSHVADMVAALRAIPGLELPDQPVVAVNQEYARLDQQLEEGDEVALIPPVAGG
jgi:molybdopterin converting factor subunit 1